MLPSFSARNLAGAFLGGEWSLEGLVERGNRALGVKKRWLRSLAQRVFRAFADQPLTFETLVGFIGKDRGWQAQQRAAKRHGVFWTIPSMSPHPGNPSTWQVPDLPTTGRLADWLGVSISRMDWFADCLGWEVRAPAGPLRHYTYTWLKKPAGRWRLLESPRPRLKALQRRILHEILDRIPPHEAVHGFRASRSIATYLAPHAGRAMVLHMDLENFFSSVRSGRVHALFRTAGYPQKVARLLTGLCTNVVPGNVWDALPPPENPRPADRELLAACHLPQGAPTSPALANLCAYRLDCRLDALARVVGARYTRYADDLCFSGDEAFERCVRRFHITVCRIVLEEGFTVHVRKTRFMRQSVRQQSPASS